mmetsp:Transcript_36848/g.88879  ORF Transcript_36848/g.88879 Transcript_36848/m.88879 type:complete len:345 (+) Transcript_36848:195-1229(+)
MAAKESSYGATTAAASASPAPTNVQVIAPATLDAGYTFDAMYEGATFTVVVPDGGVIKGQRFIVPFAPPPAAAVITDAVAVAVPAGRVGDKPQSGRSGIPTGIWRDGLCDCCRFGPCHPHFLCALWFQPLLLGQVLTRMKMTWLGQRAVATSATSQDGRWRYTFRNIVLLIVLFYGIMPLITPTPDLEEFPVDSDSPAATYDDLSDTDKVKYNIQKMLSAVFGAYFFYLMIRLRATIRQAYSIPEESCLCLYRLGCDSQEGVLGGFCGDSEACCSDAVPIGWEDICCAIWCQLCTVAQMARHTADYEEKRAVCCNAVGVGDWEDDEAYEGVETGRVGEGSVLVV